MWNRQVLKTRGRLAFKANYWRSVLVAFIATLVTGTASTVGNNQFKEDAQDGTMFNNLTSGQGLAILLGVSVIVILLILFGVAFSVFLLNPLSVGCDNFFLMNRNNPGTDLSTLSYGFENNYKNVVLTMFMKNLYIFLWTLLFIIPGVVKSYEYMLVSYLLVENPDMDYQTALKTSSRLMNGHKWNAFVLDLSFIGWLLLGAFTAGIANAFYTQPFMEATHAELYMALAHPAIENENGYVEETAPAQTVEFVVEEAPKSAE